MFLHQLIFLPSYQTEHNTNYPQTTKPTRNVPSIINKLMSLPVNYKQINCLLLIVTLESCALLTENISVLSTEYITAGTCALPTPKNLSFSQYVLQQKILSCPQKHFWLCPTYCKIKHLFPALETTGRSHLKNSNIKKSCHAYCITCRPTECTHLMALTHCMQVTKCAHLMVPPTECAQLMASTH